MSKPRELSLLARWTGRRATVRREPEPADLGTAFGMEEWLSTPQSHQAPSEQKRATVAPSTGGWRLRWLSRTPAR